jgi:hypothetical protein
MKSSGGPVREEILNIVGCLSSLQKDLAEIAVNCVLASDTMGDIIVVSVPHIFDGHKLDSVPTVNEISAATMLIRK